MEFRANFISTPPNSPQLPSLLMCADSEENRGVNDVNINTGVRHVPPQRCAPYVVLLTTQ